MRLKVLRYHVILHDANQSPHTLRQNSRFLKETDWIRIKIKMSFLVENLNSFISPGTTMKLSVKSQPVRYRVYDLSRSYFVSAICLCVCLCFTKL